MVKSCWICKTAGNNLNKSYFRIPKVINHRNSQIFQLSRIRKEKWHKILFLPNDTSGIRICSDHFISGSPAQLQDVKDPDWIPTKNLNPAVKRSLIRDAKLNVEGRQRKKIYNNKIKHESDIVICRYCKKNFKQELSIDIFNSLDSKVLLQNISLILGHEISANESFSHYLCQSCVKKVRFCAFLIEFFKKNERHLIQSLISKHENDSSICDNHETKSETHDLEKSCEQSELQQVAEDAEVTKNYGICCKRGTEHGSGNCFECEKNDDPVLNEKVYDKEQIRSIIEDNSFSSEEDSGKNTSKAKLSRRKYNVQSVTIRSIEIKTLKCNNCFRKFVSLEDLKAHKNFCKLFYCQLCKPQVVFRHKDEQILHKRKYHSQPLICHVCGKSYSQSYLSKHFRNHFEDKKKCPYCNKILKNSTLLMTHIDNFHNDEFNKICERCGDHYTNLKKHLVACESAKDL